MKTDYSALDAEILRLIGKGVSEFDGLKAHLITMAELLTKPDRFGCTHAWRTIDRRLQALRVAGKIGFERKSGWRLAS